MEMETKEIPEMEIIEEGTAPDSDIGPQRMCCWGAFSPMLA